MYYVRDECPLCLSSTLGIRMCGQGHMLIMCDVCYAIWLDPGLSDEPIDDLVNVRCPYGDDLIFDGGGHWATQEEIEQNGWWEHVIGEGGSLIDP